MANTVASLVSSLRYLLADFIGDEPDALPSLPEGLPEAAVPIASEAVQRLMDYQGASYAQLYVDRLQRFIGRRGVDEAMFCEIARLMVSRMSYHDPIRIAQLKLAEFEAGAVNPGAQSADDVRKFRLDELIGALPAVVAEPVLGALEWMHWTHRSLSISFSTKSRWGIRRLKIEASLRRWRRFSVRYAEERAWVERWLHMIGRSLVQQPTAANEIVRTADMIQGYGYPYRQGLADWHAIIDGLVKPALDGGLPLADLAVSIAEARGAAKPDPRQAALKRTIAQIRARAMSAGSVAE